MKALSFASSILLVCVLLVSASAQAQESPYERWELQDDDALFSLLGTTSGGDGRTTFSLPDLRGRVANSDPQVPTPYGNDVPEAGAGDEQPYGWLRSNDEYAEGGRAPIREAEFPVIYELDEFRYPTACPRPPMCVPDPPTIHELDDLDSGPDVIPFQIRRRSEDQPASTPTNIGFEPWKSDYYITETRHAVSTGGYRTSFRSRENYGND